MSMYDTNILSFLVGSNLQIMLILKLKINLNFKTKSVLSKV